MVKITGNAKITNYYRKENTKTKETNNDKCKDK